MWQYAGHISQECILMPVPTNTNAYLECEALACMDWTARSLDLNLIKRAWDILQRSISARPVQPRTLQERKDALVAEWRLIPQNPIQTLILSMRRRCCAVIDARGRHAHYKASFSQQI